LIKCAKACADLVVGLVVLIVEVRDVVAPPPVTNSKHSLEKRGIRAPAWIIRFEVILKTLEE
jgi:hypothetical protein